MLVNLNSVLKDAQKNRYAVGLFNTVNLEMAKGVLAAAEALRSPVIIGTAEILLPYAGLEELAPMLIPMAERATVPVVLHFDHGLTAERTFKAMELGFTSVMYDCSTLSYEENIRAVAEMAGLAHKKGITLEGELGHVGANGGDKSIYTEPREARVFAEKTGVDALAVAIGTAHGAYKSTPKLDIGRLSEIAAATAVPLVLHGGSGLSDEDFRNTVARGIAKINIFTDINCAAAKAAHGLYRDGMGMTDIMNGVTEAVKEVTMGKMRLFGSAGRV